MSNKYTILALWSYERLLSPLNLETCSKNALKETHTQNTLSKSALEKRSLNAFTKRTLETRSQNALSKRAHESRTQNALSKRAHETSLLARKNYP